MLRQLTNSFSQPHIVRYIENFDYNDRLFIIVMEYVANGDLGKLIADNRPLTEQVVQNMTVQLLGALRYLHINNITHRDVKPDNILINSLDPLDVKLTDFGLSKMVDSEVTFLRTFCGTLLYCAPEVYTEYTEYDENGIRARGRQMRRVPGQRYSHAIDIWSLGGVLFYALTGSPPYPTRSVTSPSELLHKVMTTDLNVNPLHHYDTSAPGIDFLCHMLQRRPEQRATVQDLEQHPWLADFGETIQASQSYDEITDDEEFSGQPGFDPYGEDDMVSDSINGDSDQENRTVVPSNQGPRLFGEVGVSAIGSSGAIPEEYLNLPTANPSMDETEIESNIDEAYNSGESPSDSSDDENMHGQAGASIFPNQSNDQLQSLVEDVASQSLGGDDKKDNDVSTRRSVRSIDPNTSKRKPASVETSDEFDENTPPSKPTIKRLKSEGNVEEIVSEAMVEEYKLLANVPQIKTLGFGRQDDGPVIKSSWWTQDVDTWHMNYPEMTRLQYNMFKEATRQRNEDFRPKATPLWQLAMKYFPPTRRGSLRNGDNSTLSMSESVVRASEFPATGDVPQSELHDAQIDSQYVVPIPNPETAVGMIESDPGSCIPGVSFPITDTFVSFGRGPENTKTYEPKSDTRVPKYAFKILLQPDSYDAGKNGLPWTNGSANVDPDAYPFWISTKATNGIRINGNLLRSSNPKSPKDPSEHWARLYHGDVITIWQNSTTDTPPQTKLVFRCFWGASSKRRDAEGPLETASSSLTHKLNGTCKRAEARAANRRTKAEAKSELQARAYSVEAERHRNVAFEEKRQEAIRFLAGRQPLISRRLSPGSAPATARGSTSTF
jgi:serine/threonine protein kinase